METIYATLDVEGYVCEDNNIYRTGTFDSWEEAVKWFRDELGITLERKVEK